MSVMCPLCSGLMTSGPSCPCGGEMEDSGPVTDYFGPYSPYFSGHFESRCCVHLFTCPSCGRDTRLAAGVMDV